MTLRTAIAALDVAAYRVPTDAPESDGTLEWDATTLVLVRARAGGEEGLGYSYADTATATLVRDKLAPLVLDADALDNTRIRRRMLQEIRNLGRPGIASMAISAVDCAMWDLKAKLLAVPLATLLGCVRDAVPVYGSGGFTSYDLDRLQRQLGDWAASGIVRVKMKVGREPRQDARRVHAAREAIGPDAALFVDANGAYTRKQALAFAELFARDGVAWFEEPVSSDDLDGLRLLRDRAPPGMDIAAGEYGYDLFYFERMLAAGAVDVLQADATRCAGITGFMRTAVLCEAHGVPFSAHCAPALHLHAACAAPKLVHIEWFHDHARIESMLFDGAPVPRDGAVQPDRGRPGLGLALREEDARRFAL
jgi:L-alanine-DL-glutamate epimerase-like enolase superfamily enzyme